MPAKTAKKSAKRAKKPSISKAKRVTKSSVKSKKSFPLGRVLLAVLVGLVGLAIYLGSQPITDEELVQKAIINNMSKQTSTIAYYSSDNRNTIDSSFDVDYSDITKPASKGTLEIVSADTSTLAGNFEFVFPGDGFSYFKVLEQTSGDQRVSGDDYDRWFKAPNDLLSLDSNVALEYFNSGLGQVAISAISIGAGAATAQGEIPEGNFSEEQRNELLQIIEDEGLYDIYDAADVELDGKTYRKIGMTLKESVVVKLNQKVVDYTGEQLLFNEFSDGSIVWQAYIDPDTQRFYRYETTSSGVDSLRTDTNYNQEIEISAPKDAVLVSEYLGIEESLTI